MATPSSLLQASPQLPVLLVFAPAASTQRTELDQLMETIRPVVNPAIRIMRLNETAHPEVVRSFRFASLPAFVLLQQGLELWRHTGPINNAELLQQLAQQTSSTYFKTN